MMADLSGIMNSTLSTMQLIKYSEISKIKVMAIK